MKTDKRFAKEFGSEKPSGLLKLLAVFLVTSMLSLDGLVVVMALLLLLSLGGYLTVWLPGFAWICLMLALGCVVFGALLFIILVCAVEYDEEDGSYPGS